MCYTPCCQSVKKDEQENIQILSLFKRHLVLGENNYFNIFFLILHFLIYLYEPFKNMPNGQGLSLMDNTQVVNILQNASAVYICQSIDIYYRSCIYNPIRTGVLNVSWEYVT